MGRGRGAWQHAGSSGGSREGCHLGLAAAASCAHRRRHGGHRLRRHRGGTLAAVVHRKGWLGRCGGPSLAASSCEEATSGGGRGTQSARGWGRCGASGGLCSGTQLGRLGYSRAAVSAAANAQQCTGGRQHVHGGPPTGTPPAARAVAAPAAAARSPAAGRQQQAPGTPVPGRPPPRPCSCCWPPSAPAAAQSPCPPRAATTDWPCRRTAASKSGLHRGGPAAGSAWWQAGAGGGGRSGASGALARLPPQAGLLARRAAKLLQCEEPQALPVQAAQQCQEPAAQQRSMAAVETSSSERSPRSYPRKKKRAASRHSPPTAM